MKKKVTRKARVANSRVKKLVARATEHDQKLLKQAGREQAEGATCRVSLEMLRGMRERLRLTQHAVVRAPNRDVPMLGYGPIAALQAYDGIQGVIERLDDLLSEAQP